jgi:hypothetical protein
VECKVYHNVLMNTKSQVDFDCLLQLHILDKTGDNWTVNDKVDIHSGIERLDTVIIGFFLEELYGLSYCACDIGNAFSYRKTKEKSIKLLVLNLEQIYTVKT